MIEFGMDWYPEQWDPSIWKDDLRRMKDLGISVLRIGEFAWSRLEPEEGVFDFDWFDQVMDLAQEFDMRVIIGTPTNCPPVWMYEKYPETLRVDKSGKRIEVGVRGHRCLTSPKFQEFQNRIIDEIVRRYSDHPMLKAFQIDNELEANGCTCPSCTEEFRSELKEKYRDLDRLNREWGLSFWSGEFSDWDQIHLTMPSNRQAAWYNPSYVLEKERWKAKSLNRYVERQKKALDQKGHKHPITTNFCLAREIPDYHRLSENLDVVSYDNYPPNSLYNLGKPWSYTNSVILDYVRGFKRKNFWVMEQLAGPMGCWSPIQPALVPGMIEGYGIQAIAHGCNLEVFFRWRTASKGAEMFCYGLLDHNNKDNRRLKEVKHLIERMNRIDDLDQTEIVSDTAILYGRDQEVSLSTQAQRFEYWTEIRKIHGALSQLGKNVDIIEQSAPIDSYKNVIVPSHFVYQPGMAEKLEAFAKTGGTVILTARSGVKDELGNCFECQVLPGPFASLCSIEITESDALGTNLVEVAFTSENEEGQHCTAAVTTSGWADLIEPVKAETIAVYNDSFYKGTSAITRNSVGKGEAWYVGSFPDKDGWLKLFRQIFSRNNTGFIDGLPEGIEVNTRSSSQNTYVFIFNNTGQARTIDWRGEPLHFESLEAKILKNDQEWL